MLLNLDNANRSFVEIEVSKDEKTHILKFYEQNGKQKKAQRKFLKDDKLKIFELEELMESQFFERLVGDDDLIESIKSYYDENGDISVFIAECEKALGKQKKKV